MKFVYCQCSVYNPGGMERVLLNKIKWLVSKGHEVVIVTTDQNGRKPFYEFPCNVRMIDLKINYSADNKLSVFSRIIRYWYKRRLHKKRLSKVLLRERPDVTVSLFPSESSFIPTIKDGSRKVLELHFNRYFRLQYGRSGLLGAIDRWRTKNDVKLAQQFDRFVVLTEEDRNYWGNMHNICVIPNAAMPLDKNHSDCSVKRVIAVGRLDYQKGFDRLLRIWQIVMQHGDLRDWRLDIFGQGEWREKLFQLAKDLGISNSVNINAPVNDIAKEYLNSSILVMTSNYEGFPMVMIEGMTMGLPVVSFDFKCGPKDIILNNHNGIIVSDGDEAMFANKLSILMHDARSRRQLGQEARKIVYTYSEESVMSLWMNMFNQLTTDKR